MKLIVSNLPDEIKIEKITRLFEEYGKVMDVTLLYNVYTKKFNGMAYVAMSNTADARNAMKKLNGTLFEENSISVQEVIAKQL